MPLTFANKITICRIVLVPFFIATLFYYSPEKDYLRYLALGIFLFAVISDVIDGYIARTRHQKTRAGAVLDPLADKILVMSAFICLYKIGIFLEAIRLPMWLVIAVISRDVILLLGAMIMHLLHIDFPVDPTRWGKATTFFQIVCLLGVLLQWSFSQVFWYVTLGFTLISGIDYIRKGIKILNLHSAVNVKP